jgi:hypothetical protein
VPTRSSPAPPRRARRRRPGRPGGPGRPRPPRTGRRRRAVRQLQAVGRSRGCAAAACRAVAVTEPDGPWPDRPEGRRRLGRARGRLRTGGSASKTNPATRWSRARALRPRRRSTPTTSTCHPPPRCRRPGCPPRTALRDRAATGSQHIEAGEVRPEDSHARHDERDGGDHDAAPLRRTSRSSSGNMTYSWDSTAIDQKARLGLGALTRFCVRRPR